MEAAVDDKPASPPEPAQSGTALAKQFDTWLNRAGIASNVAGAVLVAVYSFFFAPGSVDDADYEASLLRNSIGIVIYLAITLPLGRNRMRKRFFAPLERWLRSDKPAGDAERLLVLTYPRNFAITSAAAWSGAALLFTALNLGLGLENALAIGITILLGGATACALQYLLVEWTVRPLTARALAGGPPPRVPVPGVTARVTMAWTLATGVPLIGAFAIAVADVAGANFDQAGVVPAVIFLTATALAVGIVATVVAARSVAGPVTSVERALERVERGEYDVAVPVNDGSEVGRLQAGFNRMVGGLRERERLRDAFGAFVDPGLTERVLEEGTDLAGEEVELSILFLDVRGFTGFAERADAQDVVAKLNELWELIVPIVLRHGGHASKFIGDGLLAVFGAPERLDDHADRAVAAALDIAQAVGEQGGELRVGVGVNSGRVVAGTIGGGGRLDFTVIGDPVNTAARVEAATRQTGDDVLITEATLGLLSDGRQGWEERPPVPLKGKSEGIALYAPAG